MRSHHGFSDLLQAFCCLRRPNTTSHILKQRGVGVAQFITLPQNLKQMLMPSIQHGRERKSALLKVCIMGPESLLPPGPRFVEFIASRRDRRIIASVGAHTRVKELLGRYRGREHVRLMWSDREGS